MSHYFIKDDALEDDILNFSFNFRGHKFTFTSNSGMFSPGHVDEASALLLSHIPALPAGSRVLDLGCGYGAIGIALSKTYDGIDVVMSDVNERALRYAEINAKHNNVKAVTALSDCLQDIGGTFDAIILNPPIHAGKETMYRMYVESFDKLNGGGALYIVMQKKHGAESSLKKLTEIFGGDNCETLYKKKGFYIFACRKATQN